MKCIQGQNISCHLIETLIIKTMAKIITAYVSDLLQQHLQGVISFSRMVELLNEKANEPEPVQQPVAYEYHNLKTGHSYVDYLPRPGRGKAEGYKEIPLFYKIA